MKSRILLLGLCSLMLTSCLFQDEDYFDKTASERADVAIEQTVKILEGAGNGWHVRYFPHPDQEFGGYNLFFKFEDGWVTAASELAGADETSTSLYSMSNQSGPTLTIDSKNEMVNFFIEPRNSQGIGSTHMGLQGDFVWTVMSADAEKVVLRGARTGNTYLLTPLAADVDWAEAMKEYQDMAAEMDYRYYDCDVEGKALNVGVTRTGQFLHRYWEITGDLGDEENPNFIDIPVSYIVTDSGVEFYEPVKIGRVTVERLNYDRETKKFSSEDGSMVISAPNPPKSENVISMKLRTSYVAIVNLEVLVTVPEDEYVVKYFLPSEIEGLTDDQIIRKACSTLRESEIFKDEQTGAKGKPLYNTQRLYPDCRYIFVAFGIDRASYLPTTGLYKYEVKTNKATTAEYGNDVAYWLGRWKVTSASSEISGKPQEFEISIRPKNSMTVYISGWGHTAIKESTEMIAQVNSANKPALKIMPTPEEESQPKEQQYVDGVRRVVRVRAQYQDNFEIVNFAISRGHIFDLVPSADMPGMAFAEGTTGTSSKGREYLVTAAEYWNTDDEGQYVYPGAAPGYIERDYGIGPYVLQKISDEYNRPPKASEEN